MLTPKTLARITLHTLQRPVSAMAPPAWDRELQDLKRPSFPRTIELLRGHPQLLEKVSEQLVHLISRNRKIREEEGRIRGVLCGRALSLEIWRVCMRRNAGFWNTHAGWVLTSHLPRKPNPTCSHPTTHQLFELIVDLWVHRYTQ